MDAHTYRMRTEAVEGRVFYENKLTAPEWVRTYFPPTESEKNYSRRPKISVPVTGETVDRLASLVYSGLSVEFEFEREGMVWEEIAERNNFADRSRAMLINPLARGSEVTIIYNVGGAFWQYWGGEFTQYISSPFYKAAGYEYQSQNGEDIKPVLNAWKGEPPKGYKSVMVDGNFFVETEGKITSVTPHGLPFAPFVFCRSVDGDGQDLYGRPYHMRFRDMLIEYNHVFSQISKAIKILQNVWVTDKEADNPNTPLRLDPDTINHVGASGKLEQAVRQLNIEPELATLSRLKQHISSRAQVPDFMTGLSDVGKVESGLALAIVSGPLTELVDRIRPVYKKKITELVYKSMVVEYIARGMRPPEFKFVVNMSESILPQNVQAEIDTLIKADAAGLIAPAFKDSLMQKVASLLELTENVTAK